MAVNMSLKTQPRELRLVKIKSWYIPADTTSYQALRDLKVPLLKVHKDFIPTLFLATKRANLKPISVPFSDILHTYLDKIGVTWKARKGRNCRLSETRLTFSAPLTAANQEAVRKLDVSLAHFFERWAYKHTPTYSTDGERLKLVVDYWFAPERDPVIRTTEQVPNQSFELELGFTKIKVTFLDTRTQKTDGKQRLLPPLIQTEVLIKAGTVWTLAHTSTCLSSEIGDVSQFMAAVGILHSRHEVTK